MYSWILFSHSVLQRIDRQNKCFFPFKTVWEYAFTLSKNISNIEMCTSDIRPRNVFFTFSDQCISESKGLMQCNTCDHAVTGRPSPNRSRYLNINKESIYRPSFGEGRRIKQSHSSYGTAFSALVT